MSGDSLRSERVLQRRKELLEAAIRTIRQKGIATSMDDMAFEAGITRPILYRFFGDRRGLIAAVSEYFATELMDSFQVVMEKNEAALETIRSGGRVDVKAISAEVIDAFLTLVENDSQLYRFLVASSGVAEDLGLGDQGAPIMSFVDIIGKQVAVFIGEVLALSGRDSGAAEPWAFGIVGMVHFGAMWWLDRGVITRKRMVEYLSMLLAEGLQSDNLALGSKVSRSRPQASVRRAQASKNIRRVMVDLPDSKEDFTNRRYK